MAERRVIYSGRWQDNLPGTYDPALAVVITDPPYGLAAGGGIGIRDPGAKMGIGREGKPTRVALDKGYLDDIPWSEHVREVLELLPAKRHVIRGPATTLIRRDYPQPRRVCVEVSAYRKRAMNRPGTVPYLWQGWAVYGRLRVERHRTMPKGDAMASTFMLQLDSGDARPRRSRHRAITPFGAAMWIVDTWADPGCVVIDPFAGLGTIGVAAKQLGFEYVGSELDPDYAADANEALGIERPTLGLVG